MQDFTSADSFDGLMKYTSTNERLLVLCSLLARLAVLTLTSLPKQADSKLLWAGMSSLLAEPALALQYVMLRNTT
jgi:hypothetical protein